MFYIESNGFSATTFISKAISSIEGMHCFHGTRALPSGLPLGSKEDLNPNAFVQKLAELEQSEGKTMGAIHAKFDPGISKLFEAKSAPYTLSVRAPIARIRSSHAWAQGKFERGEYMPLSPNVLGMAYGAAGLEASFDDVLFCFAILHILEYDAMTYKNIACFKKIFQMERYTSDPEYFSDMVSFLTNGKHRPSQAELDGIFSSEKKVNSHTGDANNNDQQAFEQLSELRKGIVTQIFRNNPYFKELYTAYDYDMSWLYGG